ncbi:flagellin [Clostridium tagluense]|uniref:Flagellin n=1 Tax=Clostridium tagluense TaxID=360422 RepID=A0A401UHN9_9CLOT|nr:flagellin [Clostridium tagluense]GCD08992.1 flagellin [Clostridium tagluense]
MIINGYGVMDSLNRVASKNKREDSTMQKLSAGKRIIKGADDAGGLCIAESFKSQIRGLSQGERNSQDAISMLQVVDGALDEVVKSLHRMKEISVQASNGTLTDEDRKSVDKEFQEIKNGISGIAEQTEFNGIKMMNSDKTLVIQIDYNPYTTFKLEMKDMTVSSIGIDASSVVDSDKSQKSMGVIDAALSKVLSYRSGLGSSTNSLQSNITSASNNGVNLTKSLSGIEDIDMASGMMQIIKTDLLANCNSILYASLKQSAESVQKILQ